MFIVRAGERAGMNDRVRSFVANDLWLLTGMATFALAGVAEVSGFGTVGEVIGVLGLFLFTPAFLFWGDEIAALLLGDRQDGWTGERGTEPQAEGEPESATEAEEDAVEELKRRYAAGEIDDAEFECRLDRLLSVDDALDGVFHDAEPTPGDGSVEREPTANPAGEGDEREQGLER